MRACCCSRFHLFSPCFILLLFGKLMITNLTQDWRKRESMTYFPFSIPVSSNYSISPDISIPSHFLKFLSSFHFLAIFGSGIYPYAIGWESKKYAYYSDVIIFGFISVIPNSVLIDPFFLSLSQRIYSE